MIDWTKDTHCPYCEKELPNESQCDEADEIQAQFGLLSQQARTYIALFCWDYPELVCATYQREDELEEDVADRRVRQLLTERDTLRGAMREALQELVALRHGSAMKIIEDALGDKVCELEDIPTCPVCGEPMTRRNADGTLGCNLCYALDGDA